VFLAFGFGQGGASHCFLACVPIFGVSSFHYCVGEIVVGR